jgi:hypothetical protein
MPSLDWLHASWGNNSEVCKDRKSGFYFILGQNLSGCHSVLVGRREYVLFLSDLHLFNQYHLFVAARKTKSCAQ